MRPIKCFRGWPSWGPSIQRHGWGLYPYPNRGIAAVAVSAGQDEIAAALGRQTGSQVVPSGAMAAAALF